MRTLSPGKEVDGDFLKSRSSFGVAVIATEEGKEAMKGKGKDNEIDNRN